MYRARIYHTVVINKNRFINMQLGQIVSITLRSTGMFGSVCTHQA